MSDIGDVHDFVTSQRRTAWTRTLMM